MAEVKARLAIAENTPPTELLTLEGVARQRKRKELARVMARNDKICLQEVHGTDEELVKFEQHNSRTHTTWWTTAKGRRKAGVVRQHAEITMAQALRWKNDYPE